jgi:hypothetical protein
MAQQYRRSVGAGPDIADETDLLTAAETARRAGRLADARASYFQAAEAAERAHDDPAFIAAALGVGGIWVDEHRDAVSRARAEALWRRAETLAPIGSIERARLSARVAAEAVYRDAPADPVLSAVESVRALGDDIASAEALSLLHHVQLGPRYAETRLAIAEEIVRLAARGGDDLLISMGLCWRTVDLFLVGNPRAEQSLTELRERLDSNRCDAIAFVCDLLSAMLLARRGRLDMAEVTASAALTCGTAVGDADAAGYYGGMLAALRWWQGRAHEIVDVVRTISTSPRLGINDHVYVAADAVLSVSVGDVESAEEAIARARSVGLEELPHSSSWLTTHALLAEAAYVLGDAHTATEVKRALQPYAHLPVMPSLAVVCLGSAERALGLAAATTGHLGEAIHHLDAAVLADGRLGNRPMAILTEHTLAGLLQCTGAASALGDSDALARRANERARHVGVVLPEHPQWLRQPTRRMPGRQWVRTATLERASEGWRVEVEGRVTLHPNKVGFAYLHQLISRPNADVDVIALTSCCGFSLYETNCGPILDDEALRNYRRRAEELASALARRNLDAAEEHRYQNELAALAAAVDTATGRGGRSRMFPDSQERARTAVRKALLRAIAAIATTEPSLALHLRSSVITGSVCRYEPQSGWTVIARSERATGQRTAPE